MNARTQTTCLRGMQTYSKLLLQKIDKHDIVDVSIMVCSFMYPFYGIFLEEEDLV